MDAFHALEDKQTETIKEQVSVDVQVTKEEIEQSILTQQEKLAVV